MVKKIKRVCKRFFKKSFSILGLNVSRKVGHVKHDSNPFHGYDYGMEGNEAVKLTKDYSMMPHLNLFTLYEQAVYCEKNDIEGCFIELGVWKGGAVGVMAKANLDHGKKRRELHLFDAFDDICWPVAEIDGAKAIEDLAKFAGKTDVSEMKGQLVPVEGVYDFLGGHGTIPICKDLLEKKLGYPSDMIKYHKGWFQETVPVDSDQIEKIAILRLDGDYYHSIKVCLDFLFDKVVRGGIIIIDDYGYYDGCTKAVDEFLSVRKIHTFLSYSTVGCRYFIKS